MPPVRTHDVTNKPSIHCNFKPADNWLYYILATSSYSCTSDDAKFCGQFSGLPPEEEPNDHLKNKTRQNCDAAHVVALDGPNFIKQTYHYTRCLGRSGERESPRE